MHEVNIPEVVAEVTEVFERYETALQANDADTLDELFWNSPHTVRYAFTREHYYGHAFLSKLVCNPSAETVHPARMSVPHSSIGSTR